MGLLEMATHSSQPTNQMPPGQWPVDATVLLEAAPNGVLIADSGGHIRMFNSEIERLFGYDRMELIGAEVEDLIPASLRRTHLLHRAEYKRYPALRPMGLGLSLLARRKDASEFPVEISLSPVETDKGNFVIAVIRDVTERLHLEEERNSLSVDLETERERQRIGMDLHDGIMQEVYALGLRLELALEDLDDCTDDARRSIERAIDGLQGVIGNMRSYIFDLRPREFDSNLRQALSDLAREVHRNSQIEMITAIASKLPEIPLEPSIMLYHITHEALSNIQKHSGATHVTLRVQLSDGDLVLEVKDDGRGFDPDLELPESHRGMRNMAARAQRAGAELTVRSEIGSGTIISVRLP